MVMRLGMIAGALWMTSCRTEVGSPNEPHYAFEETRALVDMVEEAAALVEVKGRAAFEQFARDRSQWFRGSLYLFIYDVDGNCVFHPVYAGLIGRNRMDLHDILGKPYIRYITDIGRRPEPKASDWVFYFFQENVDLFPRWKASYIRKAVAPDGKTYVVGSGLYDPKVEEVFVRRVVELAVERIRQVGQQAFVEFRDPSTPYVFLDTYVFVIDMHGRALVDPAFPSLEERNLWEFRDAVGHLVVQDMTRRLASADVARVMYMWPKPGASMPSRKMAYIRKVVVDGEPLIVGSDFFMASPIWMRL